MMVKIDQHLNGRATKIRAKIEPITQNDYTINMTTFQLTLDEKVWAEIDSVIAETGSSRAEFIKEAIEMALHRYRIRQPKKQIKLDEDPELVKAIGKTW